MGDGGIDGDDQIAQRQHGGRRQRPQRDMRRMAKLERDIGHAVNSEEVTEGSRAKTPVWLDELDPDRGDYATEPNIECSIMCAIAESEYS